MKKLIIALIILCGASVGTFLYLKDKIFEIRIPEQELQQTLDSKLPIEKEFLMVFSITLSNPRVELVDGSDRFHAGLDATLTIKLKDVEKPFSGSVDASGSISYQPETGEVFVIEPVVESLALHGLPEKYTGKAQQVVTLALQKFYKDHPVYTLKPTDLKKATARAVLKGVMVENDHLVVQLGI